VSERENIKCISKQQKADNKQTLETLTNLVKVNQSAGPAAAVQQMKPKKARLFMSVKHGISLLTLYTRYKGCQG